MSRAQPGGVAALISDYRRFAGRRLWLSFALMMLGALAEGFGLLLIVPLATIAMGNGGRMVRFAPWLQSWSVEERFIVALALFVTAMAARSLLLVARDTSLARLQADYEASLRLRSAATLARRGWPFASSIGQAGMQSLLLNDVPRASHAAGFVQLVAVGGSMLLVQLAVAVLLSPALTVVAVSFLVIGGFISIRFARRGAASGLAIVDAMDQSAGSGFRLHAGLKAAMAQGTVAAFLREYRSTLLRTARVSTRAVRDYTVAQQLTAFGGALVASVLLLIGVRLLALPFAVLVASLVVFARMSGPAQTVQNNIVRAVAFAAAFTAIERRLGKLDWNVPEDHPREPLDWNELRLEGVRLEHQPGLGVTEGSLTLKSGEWLGIKGASGAGKTTLLDLAVGLLAPEAGGVTIDGRPLDGAILDRWAATLAYVGQEGSVFNDSVRGNLVAERVSASDADLWEALEMVGLAPRVRAFAGGLDRAVGDRGSHLSGGERQRLVLARALLRRPTLLILDEATAALDPESEATLIDRLRALQPRPAALVVAHRPSTLAHCDSVVSIQHGIVSAAA
jgi:ABC-type multidrug transport system fused ATPase/permease subunit